MRAPVTRGDSVVISSVADANPISYPLARIPNNVSYETVSQQAEAELNQPVTVPLTFHGGLAYSKYDPRTGGCLVNTGLITNEPNIIRPALGVGTIVLTGAANPPNYFFEATVNDGGADDGQPVLYIIANEAAEINVYKISLDSGDFGTLLNTLTFAITPTQPCGKPAEWNDGSNTKWYLGLGDNGKIQRLTTIVSSTAADTWTASGDADARHLKVVGNRLVRSTNENQVSILPEGSDPMDEANWASDFPVGSASSSITELGEAGPHLYAAKEDGFYEWDLTGDAVNVFPEIGKATRNGQGMKYWHGGFLIPAESLWWTRTGKPVGPDSNPNNRANHPSLPGGDFYKHGRWVGLADAGEYIYLGYISSQGTNLSVLYGRERDSEDVSGWGPIIWNSISMPLGDLDDFHGIFITRTSEFSATQTRPCLWFPSGNYIRYMFLDKDGAPASRRGNIDLSGTNASFITSGDFDFGYPRVPKQLHMIDGWSEDINATGAWQFSVFRDGGSVETVGSTITADGYFQRFWTQDTNDTTRSMLVECKFVVGGTNTNLDGPHLRDVMIRAVLQPAATREWVFLFAVEDKQSKTAKKIRSELEGYIGDLKKYILPDRDSMNGVMGKIRMLRADEISRLTPRNQTPPSYVISASVREVSGS